MPKNIDETNFNKIIGNCVKDLELRNKKNYEPDFKDEKHYHDTLKDEMKEFLKKFTPAVIKSIDAIIYNKNQTDGLISGAIAYHYLKENDRKDLRHFRLGPGAINIQNIKNQLIGKTILIMDLLYNDATYQELAKICKQIIVIDDHKDTTYRGDLVFVGNGTHAACAYVWMAFYSDKKVPFIVQYIDVSDNKKNAKHLPYSHLVATAIGYRYTNSPYISKSKWESGEVLNEIWKLIDGDTHQLYVVIGKYMNELQENLKEQIAINAVVRNFQGYRVAVLNFSDPALTKRVGRQMLTNMEQRGEKVDFAVLWAYEYTANGYKIQLIDDHKQTQINLPQIAIQLAKIGGHPRGGGGHGHVANFYWPRDNKHDIWDLFEKKLL